MDIYIVSHGRPHRQKTWTNLPKAIQSRTNIVVYEDEMDDYAGYPLFVIPAEVPKGIGHKRQYLLEQATSDKLVVLDDDLVFATRRKDDDTKFVPSTEDDLKRMFAEVADLLNDYAHGAVAMREGGNRRTDPLCYNTRALRAHFYRRDILMNEGVRFDRVKYMEDFDVTLQLLRKGYQNVLLNSYVQNQSGSNTEGGCSGTRTLEKQAEAAHRLHELHPDYVDVVQKETKSAWGGGERTDVRVGWKKAYRDA